MHDPFEESLRDMLNASSPSRDDAACLDRVLRTANRQVGAGALFGLLARCAEGLVLGVSRGADHVAPVSRRPAPASRFPNKAD